MQAFDKIEKAAAKRNGGAKALDAMLVRPHSAAKIRQKADDRWLSEMTKCVFQAGFNWRQIENKWPSFEKAFANFNIASLARMSPDEFDCLLKTDGIVKNAAKIKSVTENACYLARLIEINGSVGAHFAGWTRETYCDDLCTLQKNSSRLGGRTAQIFLRRMGVDTLIFTQDVLGALMREGVLRNTPGAKKDWIALQRAIDIWTAQSSRSLTEISQILAFSFSRP